MIITKAQMHIFEQHLVAKVCDEMALSYPHYDRALLLQSANQGLKLGCIEIPELRRFILLHLKNKPAFEDQRSVLSGIFFNMTGDFSSKLKLAEKYAPPYEQ